MGKGFRCRVEIMQLLEKEYDRIVKKEYKKSYLKAIHQFDLIAEEKLRLVLDKFFSDNRSKDQGWKSCKGSLYEYGIFRYLQEVINNNKLNKKFLVLRGNDALIDHVNQIVIHNWSDIFPDVDILIIERNTGLVKAIVSCKTSLRERLTETAFWKRELELTKRSNDIKLIFTTTDKDNELKIDTNRYILLHVIDGTFVTDPDKYENLMKTFRKKFEHKPDFNQIISKVKSIDEINEFLNKLQ